MKVVDAPVYTSYRSQYVGTGIPDVQLSHTVSGTYSYRNPVYGLFFSINPVFTRSKGNLLYANAIDSGIYIIFLVQDGDRAFRIGPAKRLQLFVGR